MLRRITDLQWSRVLALDGEIGEVHDAYFDAASWIMRYLVVNPRGRPLTRKLLIAPHAIALINRNLRSVSVSITRADIDASPKIDVSVPVSRPEAGCNRRYPDTTYWARSTPWRRSQESPVAMSTAPYALQLENQRSTNSPGPSDSLHLQSTRNALGYTLHAVNGGVGYITDFFFDDENWLLRYLVVHTGEWPRGRRVLVDQARVRYVNEAAGSVDVNQTREQIEQGWGVDADTGIVQNPEAAPTSGSAPAGLINPLTTSRLKEGKSVTDR